MNKENKYQLCIKQIEALFENEHNMITIFANTSALLYHELPDINWVGFYLMNHNELILGPFQGKIACMHIPLGKGVCGNCAQKQSIIRVNNVHEFPGHIACDSASNSEIVLPIIVDGRLLAILDIDSPILSRFDEIDEHYLNIIASLISSYLS